MAERILVVDDEEDSREILEAILAQEGFEVELAGDGKVALALAMADPPDLILLDLMMPGMTGIEICQELRGNSSTVDVPIIMVTAAGQAASKQEALLSGADDFISKPIRPADLQARVTAMLKVRQIDVELDRTLAYLHELEAIRLAQQRAAVAERPVETHPEPPVASGPIPLVLVDDEAFTREFYGDVLTQHGFHVYAAGSGQEALELARLHPVETLILDIVMPGMSGLEVLERIHEEDPDLPIIMLTGRPTAQNAIAALKLGAFDFLVKGLDHNLVVLTVHRAVRHRRETLARNEELRRLRARLAAFEGGDAARHAADSGPPGPEGSGGIPLT